MLKHICQRCAFYQSVQLPIARTVTSYNVQDKETKPVTGHHWLEQLPKWSSKQDILTVMLDNVLYEDSHIVAFNKPANLAMYSPKVKSKNEAGASASSLSIHSVRQNIGQSLDIKLMKEIFSVNRLYSGVTVFAKTQRAVDVLSQYFIHVTTNKIECQRYRALTIGIPENCEEKFIMNRRPMDEWTVCFKSEKSSIPRRKQGQAREIIASNVHLNTISTSNISKSCGVAVIDIFPTKCKWDLLQVFLLHKLAPALGDHQYSPRLRYILGKPIIMDYKDCAHQDSIQTLPPEIQTRLQLKIPSDIAKLPLHIHCHELSLPKVHPVKGHLASEKVLIEASLPSYFEEIQSLLGLNINDSH